MFGEDGQVTVMGIIPDERRPKETWAAGWAHLYSLPRALSTDSSGLLSQRPLEAIDRWTETPKSIPDIDLPADSPYELKNVAEKSFRLRATFRKGDSKSVSIFVRRSPNGQEQTEIHYAWESGLLTLDRSQSSLDPMVRRDRKETPYATRDKDSVHLDVLVDRSALEVFVDGRAAFAARIYPTLDRSDGIALSSAGTGARVEKIHIARIRGKV
jgi:sucrose-6-phosphate hydrolase SacC (GH32 family)